MKSLLGLSLKFCPTPAFVTPNVYTAALPALFRSIRLGCMFPNNSNSSYNSLIYVNNSAFQPRPAPPFLETLMAQSSQAASTNTLPRPARPHWNLNFRQRTLLNSLRSQKEFKILQTDKNLGPAIMTTPQYVAFCLQHLAQPAVYRPEPSIPTLRIIADIKSFHSELIRNFPHEERDARIIIHELDFAKPAYFHGVPKIHKSPMGCRPIVSNVNSPTTGLSKWLTHQLQPYASRIQSYVCDSSTFQKDITNLERMETDILYTFDVDSMYTSIPVEAAIAAVRWFLQNRNNPMTEMITSALRFVMTENYFTFGRSNWKQLQGLAMGTPVAPVLATLYLGFYEETRILQKCNNNLRFYRRYLDDIFIVWAPSNDPFAFQRFRAVLKQTPGLSWTFEEHKAEANYLDLWIYKDTGINNNNLGYGTRTHQKMLNLYLYPTYNSAHPRRIQSGLIYGLLRKYKLQNTRHADYISIAHLFFKRLLDRGFSYKTLRRLFEEANQKLRQTSNAQRVVKTTKQHFFKVPFDPNGPSKAILRQHFALDQISRELSSKWNAKITICYRRPPNLQAHLMRTRLNDEIPLENTQNN